jgi:hypothetical protein
MNMEKLRLINSMKASLRGAALKSDVCEASVHDELMTVSTADSTKGYAVRILP